MFNGTANRAGVTIAAMDADRRGKTIELITRELRQQAGHAGAGRRPDQQVCRGYPGKRYYGGCEHVDKVERLAIDRARQLFGADYATSSRTPVSSANAAVYLALLNASDTILSMSLAPAAITHSIRCPPPASCTTVQYGLDAPLPG